MDGRESSGEIEQAAAQWVARLDRAPLLPAEQAEFEGWLAGDVRRRGALIRARALWAHAERLRGQDDLQPMDNRAVPGRGNPGGRGSRNQRALQWGGAVMASLLLGVVLLVSIPVPTAYATSKGEMRMVPLAGGATITLNINSRVNVYDDRRGVRVRLQQGEMFV